ncbi:transcriptional enhancer factor TEF-1 isoform X3 [Panthera leo]|uniref:transcriptional enhancer factor TEF-1 isoform X3 n=1 Tax=Panthera leo TaxID=9689 RepID=UPI001C69B5E8|nr:transcriptional enhancer factor TEF-1 isoform X3 [Panthera leo]
MERMSDSADKPIDNDAEGVWSPDIEQSFQEALAIYPPCGRRKIILSDEGKMYGRNELIARYIKLRTGKTRTRKQVSSHIQVLARRKSRDFHSKLKVTSMDQTAKDKALQHMAAMSSAQIVSATAIHNKLGLPGIPRPAFPGAPGFWPGMIQTGQPGSSQDVKPFVQQAYPIQPAVTAPIPGFEPASAPAPSVPAWQGRSIGTTKLRLVEFSAFLEQQRDPDSYNKHLFVHIGHANHSYSDPLLESVDIRQIYDKFPEKKGGLKELFGKGPQNAFFLVKFWADLNCNIQDDAGAFYGVTSQYESSENMTVTCSTKVCSFGKQVVEKVEVSGHLQTRAFIRGHPATFLSAFTGAESFTFLVSPPSPPFSHLFSLSLLKRHSDLQASGRSPHATPPRLQGPCLVWPAVFGALVWKLLQTGPAPRSEGTSGRCK